MGCLGMGAGSGASVRRGQSCPKPTTAVSGWFWNAGHSWACQQCCRCFCGSMLGRGQKMLEKERKRKEIRQLREHQDHRRRCSMAEQMPTAIPQQGRWIFKTGGGAEGGSPCWSRGTCEGKEGTITLRCGQATGRGTALSWGEPASGWEVVLLALCVGRWCFSPRCEHRTLSPEIK